MKLARISNTNELQVIREVEESEYEVLSRALEDINRFHRLYQIYDLAEKNFEEIISSTDIHLVKVSNEVQLPFELENSFLLHINRVFMNYLSSFRMFLDHSETYLKRRFGKKTQQVEDFKSSQSKYFDSSFEYRFYYKLRNFTQHCGLPITIVNYSTERDALFQLKHDLTVCFDTSHLSAIYDGWGSQLVHDMKSRSRVEFYSATNKHISFVRGIYKDLRDINNSLLEPAIRIVREFTGTPSNYYERNYHIFFRLEKDGNILRTHSRVIPLDIFQCIEK